MRRGVHVVEEVVAPGPGPHLGQRLRQTRLNQQSEPLRTTCPSGRSLAVSAASVSMRPSGPNHFCSPRSFSEFPSCSPRFSGISWGNGSGTLWSLLMGAPIRGGTPPQRLTMGPVQKNESTSSCPLSADGSSTNNIRHEFQATPQRGRSPFQWDWGCVMGSLD